MHCKVITAGISVPGQGIPMLPSEHTPLGPVLVLRALWQPSINDENFQGNEPQMIDQHLARLRTHHANIQRYRNLLQTNLTEIERQFVEKRLVEEQSNLNSLTTSLPQ
jgi:hypothetical protein